MKKIVDINNLSVTFKTHNGLVNAVNDISFYVNSAEVLGIVGESGSGKSQTVLALLGLLANNAITSGSIKFNDQELLATNNKNIMQSIRGSKIAMIFQDPLSSLNPYLTIKSQMQEVLMYHKGMSKDSALKESIRMLDFVRINDAKDRINLYPHEFSGGMRQRVMIAMSLLCRPELLIADEPTTALDVTVQAQILQILADLKKEFDMSIIMITHDMGVVANICDRVNVMYAGNIMETGTINDIFYDPKHPYTKSLLGSVLSYNNFHDKLLTIPGEPPNLINLPQGCVFQNRCSKVHDTCKLGNIMQQVVSDNRLVKCNLVV
jgi:oligopeptide transport system ATP-binding protein